MYLVGMLSDFSFLHYFPEEGAIAGPIFTDDSDLLGVFSHVTASHVGTQ